MPFEHSTPVPSSTAAGPRPASLLPAAAAVETAQSAAAVTPPGGPDAAAVLEPAATGGSTARTAARVRAAAARGTTAAARRLGTAGSAVAARAAATGASAASATPHRLVLPVVLLTATTAGLVGLSGSALPEQAPVRAAAASAPVAVAPFQKPLDVLDGPRVTVAPPKAAAPPRAAAKASRAKRPAVVRPRYVRPVSAGISSYFGRRWGRMHEGLDFNGSHGDPIRAVTSGRVVSAGYDGGYGNMVEIRHADGVVTAYAHMSRILVRGGRVDAGEVIGLVGSTGHSTGSHLHFEVRVGGSPVNPLKWLRQKGVRV